MAASVASRSTGEATCQFDMPEACATTTSLSRWATFRAAAVAINSAIGMSREMIWGVASTDTHRIDHNRLAILDDQIQPILRKALRQKRNKSKTADDCQQGSQHVPKEIALKP
jgi:hypothetical protein